ncbi:MAG: hypothetical protein NT064_02010 [Proteobacteria bacterium]|nr:hypothetical protein [Pseudomonadota bacterium]
MTAAMSDVLRAAMGRVLQAARQPQCRAHIGPRALGATLPGGARVPGTCFELSVAQAAADIALLLCWPDAPDPPAMQLAQALAQADAQARAAVLCGEVPMKVGDLIRQLHTAPTQPVAWMQAAVAAEDASAVAALFDDEERLMQMPVQRFMAALVRH